MYLQIAFEKYISKVRGKAQLDSRVNRYSLIRLTDGLVLCAFSFARSPVRVRAFLIDFCVALRVNSLI